VKSNFKCKKIEYSHLAEHVSAKDRATVNPQLLSSFAVSLKVLITAVLSISPKKRTVSDLCECSISAYFCRIFCYCMVRIFFKKCPRFSDMPSE